jgi:cyclic-di-GMP-binding protein
MMPSFATPTQDTRLAHLTETRPKHLQLWLEQLHLSDPQTASLSILSSLSALNRQPMAADARLKLLNLYWHTIQTQVTMLQLQLSGSMLPLSEKADAHARLARELLLELGHGYKLVLNNNSVSLLNFYSKPDTAAVVYQLLLTQQRVLELCYEMYAPVPVGLWLEIHQAYQYADELGITQTVTGGSTPATIVHLYQQILLIALADPYHLMQGELTQVIELAQEYARLCTIDRSSTAAGKDQKFTLDPAVDAPPHITARMESGLQSSSARYFKTQTLIEHLLYVLAKLESGATPAALNLPQAAADHGYRYLLHRLIRSWGMPHLRRFNRYKNRLDNIDLSLGLRTIHALLSNDETTANIDESQIEITVSSFAMPAYSKRNQYIAKWQMLNNSAQGHALRNKENTPAHIKVGELIAMREHFNEAWSLSVIKWIKNVDTQTVEIGVQLLPPHARPVTVSNPLSPIRNAQPGIVFPENAALKQPNLLLVPHGMHMKNVRMDLQTDTTVRIMPGKMMLQTQSFDMFEFTAEK